MTISSTVGSEEHFNNLSELSIRSRPGRDVAVLPLLDYVTNERDARVSRASSTTAHSNQHDRGLTSENSERCISIYPRSRNLGYAMFMSGDDVLERSWSKTLFGNQHMLHVTSSIAQSNVEFTAPQVERATALSASSVHRLLGILCTVELLERVPRKVYERQQKYRRQRHPFWLAMTQMRESVRGAEDSPNGSKEGRQ